jgi:hypothetical protein
MQFAEILKAYQKKVKDAKAIMSKLEEGMLLKQHRRLALCDGLRERRACQEFTVARGRRRTCKLFCLFPFVFP